ncbi:putative transferase transcription regulator GNAT family [Helianthus debilis subsp. tardiflorus]
MMLKHFLKLLFLYIFSTFSAYYSDICVGSIACRLEKKEDGAIRVYIMTLGVLAPYRGLGIGTKLLNHVIDLSSKENIGEIYLHVKTNNEDAINFYKKFGFEITETIKNYYARITPPDCYVVTKYIRQPQSEK